MVEEILVKEPLSNEMIEGGARLIEALDRCKFVVDAGLWLYSQDFNRWRLVLANPSANRIGPRMLYKRIIKTFARVPNLGITTSQVTVMDSRDPFILKIRTALRTKGGLSRIRLSCNYINGQYLADALIYRMAA